MTQCYSSSSSNVMLLPSIVLAILDSIIPQIKPYSRSNRSNRRNSRALVEVPSNHHGKTAALWKRRCRLGHPLPRPREISSVCQSNFALRRAPQQQQQQQQKCTAHKMLKSIAAASLKLVCLRTFRLKCKAMSRQNAAPSSGVSVNSFWCWPFNFPLAD